MGEEGDQIHQLAIIGHDGHVGMGPVGPPEHAVGDRLHQLGGEGHGVVEGLAGGRGPLEAAALDPALLVIAGEVEQSVEVGLVEALGGLHRAHVVDHIGQGQLGQDGREFGDGLGVEIDHHMPAKGLDLVHHAVEGAHVRRAAKALQEGEAAAHDPALVQFIDLRLGEAVVDIGDALVATVALRDGVGDDAVVEAVAAGVHDDSALDADGVMQLAEIIKARIRGNIAAIVRIGILRVRPEDMGVRVAAQRGRLEIGGLGVGIGGQDGGCAGHGSPCWLGMSFENY